MCIGRRGGTLEYHFYWLGAVCENVLSRRKFRQELQRDFAQAEQRRERTEHHAVLTNAIGCGEAYHGFFVHINRGLFVEPDQILFGALERLAALVVALELQDAVTAGRVLHDHGIDRAWHALHWARVADDQLTGNEPSTDLTRLALRTNAEQRMLNDVSRGCFRIARDPRTYGPIKSASRPPIRVFARQVQRGLVPSYAPRLADAVRSHHAALHVLASAGKELHVLRVEFAS